MNATGKAARKRFGNRFAAKAAKTMRMKKSKGARRSFGKLPVSQSRGNAQSFVLSNSGIAVLEEVSA